MAFHFIHQRKKKGGFAFYKEVSLTTFPFTQTLFQDQQQDDGRGDEWLDNQTEKI